MSLEKTKTYGLEERTQSLLDVSRSKLEAPIPHQAPQRERVTLASMPLSQQEKRQARRRRFHRRWHEMLHPDRRMGVPQLMMLLEPNVVWDHTRSFVRELGVEVESQYGRGDFFEGWHKAGRHARGVYEGSYWELMGDCEDMADMLRSMCQAPPLMEEVPLELPEQAELPKWDDYKPILQVLPSAPALPVLRIPPFRAPIMETELPFVEPELTPLPDVPEQPHEEPTPHFDPPELIVVEEFEEPEFIPLEPPTIPAAPVAPRFGKPQHGYDWQRMDKDNGRILAEDDPSENWVGAHPFKKDEPLYVPPRLMDLPTWRHPPRPLPKLPLTDNLELDEADVELEPIPKLELAWDCGPDPEPAYASVSTTPATLSKATTPAQSRPTSAGPLTWAQPSPSATRPPSGVPQPPSPPPPPGQPPAPAPEQQHQPHTPSSHPASASSHSRPSSSTYSSHPQTPSRPLSAQQQQQQPPCRPASAKDARAEAAPSPAAATRPPSARAAPGSRPPSARPSTSGTPPQPAIPPEQIHPAASLFPGRPRRPSSGRVRSQQPSMAASPRGVSPRGPSPVPSAQGDGSVQGDLEWESTQSSVDAGRPHVWLNFNKPFADLPPVFMPDKPEQGVFNGPEPKPEDFGPNDLEELPEFQVPEQLPLPVYEAPVPPKTVQWMPPCEPRPVGFLRGTAPVILMDVSGTMNPAQRGKVNEVKECVCELLHPQGEVGTASGLFDVIAFCNQSWAWSATYSQRLSLLASTQVQYAGRQVGGKIMPGSARAADKARSAGAQLMPTEPELLADAQYWVDKWPGAVGHTNMLSSYLMADGYWNADCWYLFSDGLPDDPQQCLDFLELRAKHGHRCPIVHTVGFYPYGAPENFEGRRFMKRVAEITGGTYQEYDHKLHRIYQEGTGFVNYDVKSEPPELTVERLWAEEQLRAERKKNIRLGIVERLDVTMARVQALHNQLRVQPQLVEYNEKVKATQAQYEREMQETIAENDARKQRAMEDYMRHLNAVSQSNQDKIDAANARYQAAHTQWMEVYNDAVREWEASKASLEQERAEAIEKYQALQTARSRTPSPPRSRPVSAQAPPSSRGQKHSRSVPPSAKPSRLSDGLRPVSAGAAAPQSARQPSPRPAPSAQKQHQQQEPAVDMSVLYAPQPEEPYPSADSDQVMTAFAQAASSVWGQEGTAPSHLPPGDDNTVTMADAIQQSLQHRESSSYGSSQATPRQLEQQQQGRPPSARPTSASPRRSSAGAPASRPTSAGPTQSPSRPTSAGSTQSPSRPLSAGPTQSPSRPLSAGPKQAASRPTSATPPQAASRPTSAGPTQAASRPTSATPPQAASRPTSAGPTQAASRPTSATTPQATSRPTSAGPTQAASRPTSAGPSGRPSSGTRPTSASRPGSARGAPAAGSSQPPAGAPPQKVSSLQQLIEEGEDEQLEVGSLEGRPSGEPQSRPEDQPQQQPQPQQQQQQQQQQHPQPQAQASEFSDGFVKEDEGEGLDYGAEEEELPPLELEDSQELKRRIFPAEVVKELDDSNAERLAALRSEWESLLADTAARNARKLQALATNKSAVDQYINDVLKTYSSTFVRDVILGRCVKATTNERLVKAAEAAHTAECERIRAENALTADLHTQEIAKKRQKEAQFKQAVERWNRHKAEAWAAHEHDVNAARDAHNKNIARMRNEYDKKKSEVETINQTRMKQAEALHMRMVEDVTAINRRLAMEHAAKVEHRKTIEDHNKSRLAEAKVMHKAKLQQQAIANEERMHEAQKDHEALCARMTESHATACALAQKEFEELRMFLAAHNDTVLEQARQKFAAAVAAAQAEWEELCTRLREEHEQAVTHAREHNKQVWPQVLVARLAQEELGRVMAFAEHIKWCANKLQLGVNFMPNTPSYERVVEMQALNEALIKAFPEFDPSNYPWPDCERKLQPGTGWAPAPQPQSLDIKDPAILIIELAAGKRSAASAIAATMPGASGMSSHTSSSAAKAAGARPRSAPRAPPAPAPMPPSMPGPKGIPLWLLQQQEWSPEAQRWIQEQDKPPQERERPSSAGGLPAHATPEGRPSTVPEGMEEGGEEEEHATVVVERPSTAPSGMRPLSAGRFRFAGVQQGAKPPRPMSAQHHPACASVETALPVSPLSPSTPAAQLVPHLRLPKGTPSASASLSGTPLHPASAASAGAAGGAYFQQQALAGLSGAATAPGSPHEHQRRMAWVPSTTRPGDPQVRALSAGPTLTPPSPLASAPSMLAMGNRPVSGLSLRRPKSSGKTMPARKSIDLATMQATVNMHRTRKAPFEPKVPYQGPRSKEQAYSSNPLAMHSGFRPDFPKAEYPQVDVRALGDLQ